ncbi:MAG TPA: glycerophosphodiester phosphodiesterase [Acidimicrobiia bacterium]|nr:glycerophosphodiester phosphodiesterase [Acidimicrobiia bacterium]
MTIGFAHRGARAYERENTIDAFRVALEQGATGLESDAWLAADGEVVLVHDDVVRAGLRRLHVGRTSSDELAAHRVPRLRDLYETLGTGFELSLDVKEHRAALPIVDVARAAGDGAPARLWLCSGNAALLEELRHADDDVRLVHSTRRKRIAVPVERHAAELKRLRVDAINLHYTEWTKGLVALFHRFGVRAFAWDTQETRQLRAVLEMGIDAVYCDRPDRMMAAIIQWSS